MRIDEFQTKPLDLDRLINALEHVLGAERVGGVSRVYRSGNSKAVAFVLNGGPKGVSVTYNGQTPNSVQVWDRFDAFRPADYGLALTAPTYDMLEFIVSFVRNPIALREDQAVDTDMENVETFKPTNKLEIPNLDQIADAVDKKAEETVGGGKSMEQQYEELKEKIELVAGGRSHNIKSLLIYGAPSTGKTFTVMETIKALGLREGVDYSVKKGSITDFAAYRAFIQNIDGLLIFDDCDSVVETKVGKNMIKGALDTYPVRELSYDTMNTINTDAMPPERRKEFVDAISRVLKGTATVEDISMFDDYVPRAADKGKGKSKPKATSEKTKTREERRREIIARGTIKQNPDGTWDLPDPDDLLRAFDELDADGDGLVDDDKAGNRLLELQNYFNRRLPNKIDYAGRMIFISNMKAEDWDSAILTRTFRQEMDFANDEMLDFIDGIKKHIAAPSEISLDMKTEVLNYIRELQEAGQVRNAINFRLVQQSFDLRVLKSWKSMVADLCKGGSR